MGFWKSLAGTLRVEITSADPARLLTYINENDIQVNHIAYVSDLTLSCVVAREDTKRLIALVQRRGAEVKIKDTQGIFWTLARLRKRPVLVVGSLAILVLALCLPTRVFFVRVEGNHTVSDFQIAEEAEHCGIKFGASRRAVRSEKVKNALLGAIPQLQWAGVNTYGCVAVISVKERTQPQLQTDKAGVSSIVADRDGVVTECTVISGNPLCKVGQAVKKGQVLVSGYTDCGLSIRAQRAQAEIYGQTIRDLQLILPKEAAQKGKIYGQNRTYGILVGKKLINLSKDSGISGAGCDKITEIHALTLPGGFALPFAVVVTTISQRDQLSPDDKDELEYTWMASYGQTYLRRQMIGGQITQSDTEVSVEEDAVYFTGKYHCEEMIGRTKEEELFKVYGETG